MRNKKDITIDYPVLLRLTGKPVVVVGGGVVALRKVQGLLECGAQVKLIAPEVQPALAKLAEKKQLCWVQRTYRKGDLRGALLVIGATDQAAVNQRIFNEAIDNNVLVNIVDQPELCTFTLPARVTRGPVTVAISTGGASPMLARHLREMLEEVVGPEYGQLAQLMGKLREEVKAQFPTEAARRQAWQRLLESDVLELLKVGQTKAAEAKARACLSLPSA